MDILNRFAETGVVPVVVLDSADSALPTADALSRGGIDVMEITMRTPAALDSIRAVRSGRSDVLVGAGTVVTLDNCKAALDAGAQFIVSPGFNPKVVELCLDKGVPVTPGCVTPTEITAAIEYGLKVLKFFPCSVYGGLSALKALAAPFVGMKFIPTGGVSAANLGEFIAAPFVHAIGGSWLCTKGDINAGNFERITALSAEARAAVLAARG